MFPFLQTEFYPRHFRSGSISFILDLAARLRKTGSRRGAIVAKRKPGQFSATKAVKANARERVGQPKPSRVVVDTPRTGRQTKHKPKLDQIIQHED
jgi:hypothetical protein